MKFIFPQNYKFKTKILGIIDYQTAILDIIWGGIIFLIINSVFNSLKIKIFLFIIAVFPIFLFSLIGINGEDIITVIIYMAKFILKQKIYFYSK